jgi:DNA-binding transcriptional LysR family regulator
MSINLETLDLRAFIAVVDLEGFRRAAEALNISQPALSRRIKRLEGAVGATLLERTTRRVALTSAGRELLPFARRMLDEFDASLFSMREVGNRRAGQISLACVPTAAFYFLPSVIARFNQLFPNIRFRILDLSANDGLESVARGDVEFGINMLGGSDPELTFEPLLEDPFVLACRRDHPFANRTSLEWSDLEGQPLVAVSRASANRMLLDATLVRAGVRLSWSYEVTHLSTSLGLVEAGLGISVLPKLATPQNEHPIIVTRPIGKPEVSRTIGVVRRRGGRLAPATERFLDMLLGMWKGET